MIDFCAASLLLILALALIRHADRRCAAAPAERGPPHGALLLCTPGRRVFRCLGRNAAGAAGNVFRRIRGWLPSRHACGSFSATTTPPLALGDRWLLSTRAIVSCPCRWSRSILGARGLKPSTDRRRGQQRLYAGNILCGALESGGRSFDGRASCSSLMTAGTAVPPAA